MQYEKEGDKMVLDVTLNSENMLELKNICFRKKFDYRLIDLAGGEQDEV